jgi:NDP-sugar pyrophosphorylase family protein
MGSGGSRIHGIVLAGSYPWRNAPLERLLPRPLLPVAHQPLISYTLRWLFEAGVRSVTICVNAASRRVQAELPAHTTGWPALEYSYDAEPRGPAGCARDAALGTGAETFVVADGAAIPTVSLAELLLAHGASRRAATVAVHARGAGRGEKRRAAAPAGVYVFERGAFDLVPARGFQDVKEHLVPRLYAAGETLVPQEVGGPSPRVLDLHTYVAANHWATRRLALGGRVLAGYAAHGEALVHHTATVSAHSRLVGPVLVGPHCRVMEGATLVGPTVLGTGCIVDPEAVVSRSVAWNRCTVGTHAMVDGSVLADDARVVPGSRLAGAVHVPRRRREVLALRLGTRLRDLALALRPRAGVREELAAPGPLD